MNRWTTTVYGTTYDEMMAEATRQANQVFSPPPETRVKVNIEPQSQARSMDGDQATHDWKMVVVMEWK